MVSSIYNVAPVIGIIHKGLHVGKGGEVPYFPIEFKEGADQSVRDYFCGIYGDKPEKLMVYLADCVENAFRFTYETYVKSSNGKGLRVAMSDGEKFIFIANPQNPGDKMHPFLSRGVRLDNGQPVPHVPNLEFIGRKEWELKPVLRTYVHIKELYEQGVFGLFEIRSSNLQDANLFKTRLNNFERFATKRGQSITDVPLILSKTKQTKVFKNFNNEHFFLDIAMQPMLGVAHPKNNTVVQNSRDTSKMPDEKKAPNTSKLSESQQKFISKFTADIPDALYSDEKLASYKDKKTGRVLLQMAPEELIAQIRFADEYLSKKRNENSGEDLSMAENKRVALISALVRVENI